MLRSEMDSLHLPFRAGFSILHLSRTDGLLHGGVDSSLRSWWQALQQRKGSPRSGIPVAAQLPVLADRFAWPLVRQPQAGSRLHVHGLWAIPHPRLARLLGSGAARADSLPTAMPSDAWALARHRLEEIAAFGSSAKQGRTLEQPVACMRSATRRPARFPGPSGFSRGDRPSFPMAPQALIAPSRRPPAALERARACR